MHVGDCTACSSWQLRMARNCSSRRSIEGSRERTARVFLLGRQVRARGDREELESRLSETVRDMRPAGRRRSSPRVPRYVRDLTTLARCRIAERVNPSRTQFSTSYGEPLLALDQGTPRTVGTAPLTLQASGCWNRRRCGGAATRRQGTGYGCRQCTISKLVHCVARRHS